MSTPIENNTTELRAILNAVNALPSAGAGQPVIEPLVVKDNGVYSPPDGVDGYAPVTVDVATGGGGGSEEEWIGDGNTHIWISLEEGRTSPMLGVCPKGTVTVDWGDGTAPNVLTGTSTSTVKWTPTHNYAAAGDYVITLTVDDGTMGFYGSASSGAGGALMRYSASTDNRNYAYNNCIQKVEIGNGVTSIGYATFHSCRSLASVHILDGVTSIANDAFSYCYSLNSVHIPDGVTSMGAYAFSYCYSLNSVHIPDGVTSIGNSTFQFCEAITSIRLPDGVTSIGNYAFYQCISLPNIRIPGGVTSIGNNAFNACKSLGKLRFDPTTPPAVAASNAFTNVPTDCVISVPVGTLAAYTSATNYPDPATYTYIEED